MYARKRDVIKNGVISLSELVSIVLKEKLPKPASVRLGKWSVPNLSSEQIKYAALDAIKIIEAFEKLSKMPDLTIRLKPENIIPGITLVDIVPMHGSQSMMATRSGTGKIIEHNMNDSNCYVEVQTVTAPAATIPKIKQQPKQPLSSYGPTPFSCLIPLRMLRSHTPGIHVRNTNTEKKNLIR